MKLLHFLTQKIRTFSTHKKVVCKMNRAYLRHVSENGEKFEITFQYTDTDLKIDRQFNLCRLIDEPVSNFTSRITTNIEKEIAKKNKKLNKEIEKVSVTLQVNGNDVDDHLTCRQVFRVDNRKIVLRVAQNEYRVIVNSPWVSSLALPSSMVENFCTYPLKFDAIYTDLFKSEYRWYKSLDKKNWAQVDNNSILFYPKADDVDHHIKLSITPKNDSWEGPSCETASPVKVAKSPGPCPFEKRHAYTTKPCVGHEFRVVSYNILADLYCDQDYTREVLHPYCPPYALHIDYRKQLILKELLGYQADIICLQEVDKKMFKHDLQLVLKDLNNYEGDLCIKKGQVAEGLACFYNKNRFKAIEPSSRFVLSDELSVSHLFADMWAAVSQNAELSARILDRSQVLQLNVLQSVDKQNEIVLVANTHLYFHPDADHIRLLQGGIIIRYIENCMMDLQKKYPDQTISVIFCGDFNSVPQCGIYELYTTGKVSPDHIDFNSKPEESIQGGVTLTQNLPLKSACGKPPFTNFTHTFQECLDYIFYHEDHLKVVQSVPLPSEEELKVNVALPSVVFPSDHLSLIADFKWI